MSFEFGHESFFRNLPEDSNFGLVTNDSGRDSSGRHIVGRLHELSSGRLKAIFSPEHGFNSSAPDGECVEHSVHGDLEIPIYSLYGDIKSPSAEMLAGIDQIVYEIQDAGVRFYTYISTLRNIIECCATHDIPLHVLDRPDVLGGEIIEGPILEPGFESFVGHLPLPLRYGMTSGELALWWNSRLSEPARLTVWKCRDYVRGTPYAMLGVPWVKPSPSMIDPPTAQFYPGTCLFEGMNVSEGRGTTMPFRVLGAPWINARLWLNLAAPILPRYVSVEETSFVPTFSKYESVECRGLRISSSADILPDSVSIGITLIWSLMRSHPGMVAFIHNRNQAHPFIDLLTGSSKIRTTLESVADLETVIKLTKDISDEFTEQRKRILLYQQSTG